MWEEILRRKPQRKGKRRIVPQVVLEDGRTEGGVSGSSIMGGLLTLLLSDKLNMEITGEISKERSEEADKLRREIHQSLSKKKETPASENTPPGIKA